MILVDTSIWIDHLRVKDERLTDLLERREVLMHPMVIGEIALGSFAQREVLLTFLKRLPVSTVALNHEVLAFIEENRLFGLGVGYVDVHLLAAACLTPKSQLYTRDKRLLAAAARMSVATNYMQ